MEFQKKARRDQLCILIYVLFIYICGPCKFANSSSTTNISATLLSPGPTTISTTSKLSASKSQTLPSFYSSKNLNSTPQQASNIPPTSSILPQLLSISNSSRTIFNSSSWIDRTKKICQGVHIRNDLKSFDQLRGCEIIDGPLTIALVSNHAVPYEPKDYENITFPQLTEITGYLLFFRVEGLTHFSTLFPNLAVIRGKELVSNYALIIYEMMHLQRVNLPNLNDILRGSVRIESNPNLCYVSTVNWEAICKHKFDPHFIRDNNLRCNGNRCPEQCRPWSNISMPPQSIAKSQSSSISNIHSNNNDPTNKIIGDIKEFGAENNHSVFCWSNQVCHESCQDIDGYPLPFGPDGRCCSPLCAGGCYESNNPNACIACRYVSQGATCVEHCSPNLFEYNGDCIDQRKCESIVEVVKRSTCDKLESMPTNHFKSIRLPNDRYGGKCQADCPQDFEEDSTNRHKCKPCDKGKCRKICSPTQEQGDKPFMVTAVDSLRDLTGCNVINGSLEISLKGGKNVLHELELAFRELEEITNYLKITRSYPILTLGFLRNLKLIGGQTLDRGQYSLIIIDNPNLRELFQYNQGDAIQDKQKLTIASGTVFAHLNPKLCPNKIEALLDYASVQKWDERDVSQHTNGDKEACDTEKLLVELLSTTAKLAVIRFENYAAKMEDPRSLLYYLVNYRVAPSGTVTMFDGRDGCNNQKDVWTTIEESPLKLKSNENKSDEFQEVFIGVKPATRYALYVKTYTIISGAKGALSDIIYFETAPDTPGIPRQIESNAKSDDSVIVSWLPPSKPNGNIESYIITIKEEVDDYQNFDICTSIENREKLTEKLTDDEPTRSSLLPTGDKSNSASYSNMENKASGCYRDDPEAEADLQVEIVTFQDLIIDIVYLKNYCPAQNQNKVVKKRSIEYEPSGQDNNVSQHNSLPRKHPENSVQIESRVESQPVARSQRILGQKQPMPQSQDQSDSINSTKANNQYSEIRKFKYNRTQNKTTFTVMALSSHPNSKLDVIIHGLKHFTKYIIEIVGCHNNEFNRTHKIISPNYHRCGLQAITQVRTQSIPEYDRIPLPSIQFYPTNGSTSENMFTWKEPENPNGRLLAYRVRYKLKASEYWTEVCINNTAYNRDGGFIMHDIAPGVYVFSVRAISMYSGPHLWSDELEFVIPDTNLLTPTRLSIFIVIFIFITGFAIASGTYYYKKRKHELIYASVNPDYIQYEPDDWEVDKTSVIVGEQIGTGAFGLVYKGQLITEKGLVNCAVKTLPPTSTAKQRMDFLREASIMKQFDTFHVIKLMGVVSATTPVYVIMEFMEYGDLKEYLRGQRDLYKRENKVLVDGLYLMVAQIADGMAYLASKKFIHRDLAARNCMVGENHVVKIGDFGLTRDVYANDYYRRDTQGRLPVRWMAPESISDNLYTTASDVWSFGIVIWEIVTFSAYPYSGLSNEEVIKKVAGGHTMPRPVHCPDKLHHIMTKCWRTYPKDRPSFEDIIDYILPETEGKLYPNCFYKKTKVNNNAVDSIAQSIPEETNTGTESYPLLSWPTHRANGLTNGENHLIKDNSLTDSGDTFTEKDQL